MVSQEHTRAKSHRRLLRPSTIVLCSLRVFHETKILISPPIWCVWMTAYFVDHANFRSLVLRRGDLHVSTPQIQHISWLGATHGILMSYRQPTVSRGCAFLSKACTDFRDVGFVRVSAVAAPPRHLLDGHAVLIWFIFRLARIPFTICRNSSLHVVSKHTRKKAHTRCFTLCGCSCKIVVTCGRCLTPSHSDWCTAQPSVHGIVP